MKSLFLSICSMIMLHSAIAKKVQFNVDMRNETIDAFGVHVSGNFLTSLGLPANYLPDQVPLTQIGTSTIYSTVVDLPAFSMFEYYYLNGKETYNVEFIPYESQVIYNFIANRWIYVDSTNTDTLKLPALVYSTNAPLGKTLIRHQVDMQNVNSINSNGVHVATGENAFNYTSQRMYSFDNKKYEYLTYVDSATSSIQEYIYINGNAQVNAETVPASCRNSNNYRQSTVSTHTILDAVCYEACVACIPNAVTDITSQTLNIFLYTNPVVGNVLSVHNATGLITSYKVYNMYGQLLINKVAKAADYAINVSDLPNGNYVLMATTSNENISLQWIK